MSDIILDILRRYVDGTKIKKASARSGGEYHSPCPKCGGTDRFCLPEQPGGALAMQHGITGTWACPRHCQEGGDAIDLLTWAGGLTFREACEELRIDLPERTQEERRRYRPLRPLTAHGTDTWTPTSYASPPDAWLAQATKLATEAHARLLETPSVLNYLAKRGLPLEAVQRYGLGYIEGKFPGYLYRQRAAFDPPPRDGKPVGRSIHAASPSLLERRLQPARPYPQAQCRPRRGRRQIHPHRPARAALLGPAAARPHRRRSRAGDVGRGRIRA
ncbi:MAG: primase-helicase zinc-binding domain-containing protein [Bilophila wadsworthia]